MAVKANPNPSRVTAQMWWFWLEFKKLEPSAKLGGFYAGKPGYHNTRAGNVRGDYSVQSGADRAGPSDKCAAIDITFPDAQRGNFKTIAKYSSRLLRSGRDHADERGNFLRSFYGNADLDREVEGWDFQRVGPASSDDSHLWHLHLSFIRKHVGNSKAMRAVLSILRGESVKTWRAREAALLKPKSKMPKAPVKPPAKPATPPPVKAAPVTPGYPAPPVELSDLPRVPTGPGPGTSPTAAPATPPGPAPGAAPAAVPVPLSPVPVRPPRHRPTWLAAALDALRALLRGRWPR